MESQRVELKKIENSALKGDDYQRSVAKYVAENMLSFYKKEVFSEPKPNMLSQYDSMEYEQKIEFNKKYEDWRDKSGAEKWSNGMSTAKMKNDSDLHWLEYWASLLDGVLKAKVLDTIKSYGEGGAYIKMTEVIIHEEWED